MCWGLALELYKYLVNTLKNDELTTTVGSNTANFQYSAFAFAANDAGSDAAVTATSAAAGTYHVDASKSTITFKYAKEMDDSARQVANYTLDGKALPTGSKVDFVGDKTVVRITLPEGALSQSTQYKLGIKTDVTTKEGSKIVASLQTKAPVEKVITLADTVKPELASAIYYSGVETVEPGTKTDRLEVTFNEKLNGSISLTAAKDDFLVTVNGSEVKVASVQAVTSGDNKDRKLLLILNQEVNLSQAATVSIVDEDAQSDKTMAVKDLAGNKAKAGSSAVASNYKYNGAYAGALADQAALATLQAGNATAANLATLSTVNASDISAEEVLAINKLATSAITAADAKTLIEGVANATSQTATRDTNNDTTGYEFYKFASDLNTTTYKNLISVKDGVASVVTITNDSANGIHVRKDALQRVFFAQTTAGAWETYTITTTAN